MRLADNTAHERGADATIAAGDVEGYVDDQQGLRRAVGNDPADWRGVQFHDLEAGVRILGAVARGLSGELLPHQLVAQLGIEKTEIISR